MPTKPMRMTRIVHPSRKGLVNHAEYLRRRQEWVNMKMGFERGKPFDPMARARASRSR